MNWEQFLATLSQILDFTLFEINRTPITVLSLIMFGVMLILFGLLSRATRRLLLSRTFAYLKLDQGTSYTLSRVVHYLIMVIGVIVAFQFLGISLSGLAVIFGFLSVGIGFGLQNLTANFVAGLILLFERPIQVGDRVTVGDTQGDVEEINIRATKIRSEHNISIIVPNSEFISSRVINWSHGDPKVLMEINVGVSYDSDLETVLQALQEVAQESPHVLKTPPPHVHLTNFGDSAWDMQLRVWVADPKTMRQVRSDLNCAIVRKFREKGIEIPFPQRDLHLRSSVALPVTNEVPMKN